MEPFNVKGGSFTFKSYDPSFLAPIFPPQNLRAIAQILEKFCRILHFLLASEIPALDQAIVAFHSIHCPNPPFAMYDFCFTYPYGAVLVGGGILGFVRKGSVGSLAGGVGAGLLLMVAAQLSLSAYHKGRNSYLSLFLQTGVSIALTVVMSLRYQQTAKFMPAGLVASLSGLMALFYLYKLAIGGNHIPRKTS